MYLPFTEEDIVGFTVDAIQVGSTMFSVVEVGAVVTSGVFTDRDTDCNAADVNFAMDDSTLIIRVVADNGTSIVSPGDTTLIVPLNDSRVLATLENSVLISSLDDPTFNVAPDDSTNVVGLNDATLAAAVL